MLLSALSHSISTTAIHSFGSLAEIEDRFAGGCSTSRYAIVYEVHYDAEINEAAIPALKQAS